MGGSDVEVEHHLRGAAEAIIRRQGPLKKWKNYHKQYGIYESYDTEEAQIRAELVSLRALEL